MDFDSIKTLAAKGMKLIADGSVIVDEARENYAAARAAMATNEQDELDRMLGVNTAESVALNERIQRA